MSRAGLDYVARVGLLKHGGLGLLLRGQRVLPSERLFDRVLDHKPGDRDPAFLPNPDTSGNGLDDSRMGTT